MARTPAQRGKVGNWLVESRLARGWDTQERARAEIERLTGWRIPQSVYAEWESGRRLPSDANLERLRAFYGTQEEAASPVGEAAIVAAAIERAIGEQTEVFRELLGELRAFRLQQMEFVRTLAEARLPGEPLEPSDDPAPALRGPVPMPAQTR